MGARDIAAALKLKRIGHEWRGGCPACGYPTSFSVSEGQRGPVWHCKNCQDQPATTAAIREARGGRWEPPAQPEHKPDQPTVARRQENAFRLFGEGRPIAGTPVQRYLETRGVWSALQAFPPMTGKDALRFHPACPHPAGGRYPAMVAIVRHAITGIDLAIHRTFIKPDGSGKITGPQPRATLGPVAGGAVMLHLPRRSLPIVVGEGIETSLAASLALGAPAWAAISAGNLEGTLRLPAVLPSVIVAADNDPPAANGRRPGPEAAAAAAQRWKREGRTVRVAMPDEPGTDFADLAQRRAGG